jgi:hypothetical protein
MAGRRQGILPAAPDTVHSPTSCGYAPPEFQTLASSVAGDHSAPAGIERRQQGPGGILCRVCLPSSHTPPLPGRGHTEHPQRLHGACVVTCLHGSSSLLFYNPLRTYLGPYPAQVALGPLLRRFSRRGRPPLFTRFSPSPVTSAVVAMDILFSPYGVGGLPKSAMVEMERRTEDLLKSNSFQGMLEPEKKHKVRFCCAPPWASPLSCWLGPCLDCSVHVLHRDMSLTLRSYHDRWTDCEARKLFSPHLSTQPSSKTALRLGLNVRILSFPTSNF